MGREHEVGELLNRLVSGLRRDMERHAGELAVSSREWAVLRYLHLDSLAERPSDVEGIWKRVELPRESVMETLLVLEERALVKRHPDGWRLTRDGDSRVRPLMAIADSITTKSVSGLTGPELDDLAAMLRQMCANLGLCFDARDGG